MESNDNGQNSANQSSIQTAGQTLKVDDTVDAEAIRITEYGAFVKLAGGKKGLIHISQVADSYVKNIHDYLKVGDKLRARVMTISPDGKIDLTLKTRREAPSGPVKNFIFNGTRQHVEKRHYEGGRRENNSAYPNNKPFKTSAFEEKLRNFLKESEERQTDLNKHVEEKQGR